MRIVKTVHKADDFYGVAYSKDRIGKKHNRVLHQLEDFMASGAEVAMVYAEPGEYSSQLSLRATILKTANVYDMKIRTTVRDGTLYIIKK